MHGRTETRAEFEKKSERRVKQHEEGSHMGKFRTALLNQMNEMCPQLIR